MSMAEQAMAAMTGNATANMHTGFPANVISYDGGSQTAAIQPLFKYDDGTSYPQVIGVPVAKYRFPIKVAAITEQASGPQAHAHPIVQYETINIQLLPLVLEQGDLVWCSVSEKSIDGMSSRQVHKPLSDRKFDASDCVVLCIL